MKTRSENDTLTNKKRRKKRKRGMNALSNTTTSEAARRSESSAASRVRQAASVGSLTAWKLGWRTGQIATQPMPNLAGRVAEWEAE